MRIHRFVAAVLVACAVFASPAGAAPPEEVGRPPATAGLARQADPEECPVVALDVLLVIDQSGSMTTSDPGSLRESAARVFVDRMREQDRAGVSHFADGVGPVALEALDTPAKRTTLKAAIDAGSPAGNTNINAAVAQAASILGTSPAGRARVAVLLSDGAQRPGTYDPANSATAAAADVTIHTVGLGSGADATVLGGIASATGGSYRGLSNPSDLSGLYDEIAAQVLGDAATTPECALSVPSEFFGPNGALLNQCPCQGEAGRPVDTRTGNMWEALPGFVVEGRGPGLGFAIMYNSFLSDVPGAVGNGWSTTLDMRLELVSANEVTVHQETGSTVSFFATSAGWEAPARFDASLVEEPDGSFTYTRARRDRFHFSDAGLLLARSDLNGYETTFTYPTGSDEVDLIEDSAGRRLDVTWSGGRVTSISDPRAAGEGGPRHVAFTYEPDGDLATYRDIGGGIWKLGYDTAHRLNSVLSPRQTDPDLAFQNEYDDAGRVVLQRDERNRETTFDYDTPVIGSTTITAPDGDRRIDHYTGILRTGVTYAAGTADQSQVAYEYDTDTLAVVEMVDGRGKVWTYGHDADGRQILEVDPLGRQRTWGYDALGLVTATTVDQAPPGAPSDPVATEVDYDAAGNIEQVRVAAGTPAESVTTYVQGDPAHPGDVTRITDGRGKHWDFTYHPTRGDLVSSTDPLGGKTTYGTSSLGWVTTMIAPRGNAAGAVPNDHRTIITRDTYGREATRTNPLGDRTIRYYDENGNISRLFTDMGTGDNLYEETIYHYNEADELVWREEPGRDLLYTYHPDGSLSSWVDGRGRIWSYGYDRQDRLVTETDPAGAVTRHRYDGAGNRISTAQPVTGATCTATTRVACTTYGFDDAGQLTTIDHSDSTPDVTGITYDGAGRRTASTVGGATELWDWDDMGRLVGHTDVNGRTTAYGWDDASNLTAITYPGQSSPVTRAYDDAGRMTGTTDPEGRSTSFGYDRDGNWTGTTFPSATGNTDVRSYDRAGQLVGVEWKQGATVLGSVTSPRDVEGMVTEEVRTGLPGATTRTFAYDDLDQLVGVGSATLAHDPARNLVRTEDGRLQVFDGTNQLCWSSPTATSGTCTTPAPADATTYGRDTRGNRTSSTAPDGASRAYGYDLANRLRTVTDSGPAPLASMTGTPIPGDFDGDDRDDVFWYGPGSAPDWTTWGDERSTFGRRATSFSISGSSYEPFSGDFDGDGADDIFWYAPGAGADSVWFWFGRESGTYVSKSFSVGGSYRPVVGDFDGDGYSDVYWYGPGATSDSIWWGGPDVDAPSTTFTNLSVSRAGDFRPASGDFDNNGSDDILWYAPGTDPDVVWFGAGARNSWVTKSLTLSGTYTPVTGDFDGDGRDDLFLSVPGGNGPVYWGTSISAFGPTGQAWVTLPAGARAVPGNFDGVGGDDVLVSVPGGGGDTVWWSAARTSFGVATASIGLAPDPATHTYSYGSNSLRTRKTTNGTIVTETTWSAVDAVPALLAEHTGGTTTFVVYGPGGVPIYQYVPGTASSVLYYHQDALGSTRMTTGPTGSRYGTTSYDAYGTPTRDTTPPGTRRPLLTYTGQYRDAETGLYYLRARYYDPRTGSFLSRDPLLPLTKDPYGYASGNPANFVDPLGLCSWMDPLGCVFPGTSSSDPPPNDLGEGLGRGLMSTLRGAAETVARPIAGAMGRAEEALSHGSIDGRLCAFLCVGFTADMETNDWNFHYGLGVAGAAGLSWTPASPSCEPRDEAFVSYGWAGGALTRPNGDEAPPGGWSPSASVGVGAKVGYGLVHWYR